KIGAVQSSRHGSTGFEVGSARNQRTISYAHRLLKLGACPLFGISKIKLFGKFLATCLPYAGGVTGSKLPDRIKVRILLFTGSCSTAGDLLTLHACQSCKNLST